MLMQLNQPTFNNMDILLVEDECKMRKQSVPKKTLPYWVLSKEEPLYA